MNCARIIFVFIFYFLTLSLNFPQYADCSRFVTSMNVGNLRFPKSCAVNDVILSVVEDMDAL